jgi:uncharacterized coiled-coil DUF342 family protein
MGIIMVVQTVQQKEQAINYVKIPTKVPKEIIENDSLLVLEKSMNKFEDRLTITARTVLGMNYELKTQIFEIDRLEKAITSMHEFIVTQQSKIESLETQVNDLQKVNGKFYPKIKNVSTTGFWSRIFSK